MRLKIAFAAAIAALSLAPALAQQQKPVTRYGEEDKPKTRVEIEEEKAAERNYKRAIGGIPAKPDTDPWASARSAEPGGAKPAKTAAPAKAKPAKPAAAN